MTRKPLGRVARSTPGSSGCGCWCCGCRFAATCAGWRTGLCAPSLTNAKAIAAARQAKREKRARSILCLRDPLLAPQLRGKRMLAIDLVQRFAYGGGRHHHGAVLGAVEAESAAETVDIAVEHGADHLCL